MRHCLAQRGICFFVVLFLAAPAAAQELKAKVDQTAFDKLFAHDKPKLDASGDKLAWVLEAKADITQTTTFNVEFQDADGVAMATKPIEFTPALFNLKKGSKTRGALALLGSEEMKKVTTIVVKRAL